MKKRNDDTSSATTMVVNADGSRTDISSNHERAAAEMDSF